jgi:hypothetical protein
MVGRWYACVFSTLEAIGSLSVGDYPDYGGVGEKPRRTCIDEGLVPLPEMRTVMRDGGGSGSGDAMAR